jgi:hypothetical protein
MAFVKYKVVRMVEIQTPDGYRLCEPNQDLLDDLGDVTRIFWTLLGVDADNWLHKIGDFVCKENAVNIATAITTSPSAQLAI